MITETESTRHARERRLVDDARTHHRTGALVLLWKITNDEIGNGEVDDGVTEELQTFVGLDRVLGGVTRVGQSQRE